MKGSESVYALIAPASEGKALAPIMNTAKLVYYDTSSVYCSSYYLKGFCELGDDGKTEVGVCNSLPARLKSAIRDPAWQHLLFAMCLFRYRQGGKERFFCIDTHDANSLDICNKSQGYHLPLLHHVDAYFKVNFNPQEIARTPELRSHRDKIWSAAQFFPLRPPLVPALSRRMILPSRLWGFKPGSSHDHPYRGHITDARARLRDLKNFPKLDAILARRRDQREVDIFFMTSFYAKERHRHAMASRHRIMGGLSQASGLTCVVGFTGFETMPAEYAQASRRRLSHREYFQTLGNARIAIYTQGMERCISSKFALAMALGVALIGEPLANNPELIAANPHLKEQLAYNDPDEIVARAIELARRPGKARELGCLNAAMFDTQMSPRAAAKHILETVRLS